MSVPAPVLPGRPFRLAALAIAAGLALLAAACGEGAPSKEGEPDAYAKHLVREAIERYDDEGREAALAHYSSEASVDGPWYVFVLDGGGDVVAHPLADRVGNNVLTAYGVDIRGFAWGPLMLEAGERGRWVSYTRLNPGTGLEEPKHSWVARHDGLIFGSGWYETASPGDPPPRADRDAYTKHFVREAIAFYEREGREAALARYSSRESIDGQWYVFILDGDGEVIAHPLPDRVGNNVNTDYGVDVTGYAYGPLLATAGERGRWVSYTRLHPQSGLEEPKHSWVVRHDGLVFGSGWYDTPPIRGAAAAPPRSEPDAYTRYVVEQAIDRYEGRGREDALDFYGSGSSVDGPWYVFVIDGTTGEVVAHPLPGRRGNNVLTDYGVDVRGFAWGPLMMEAGRGGRWVSYTRLNPETGAEEPKHSWVVRHDGLIFGSGWYEAP